MIANCKMNRVNLDRPLRLHWKSSAVIFNVGGFEIFPEEVLMPPIWPMWPMTAFFKTILLRNESSVVEFSETIAVWCATGTGVIHQN